MYRTKSETKLVWWPTPQDYNEAIQIPQASLQDPELRLGLPYTNSLELPRSITGSFASVYRMHCKKKDFALRLFLSNIRDQQERYALISDFVQNDDLPCTVTFDFLKEGIKIHGEWLPALKMDWLDGAQLDDYIVDNLAKPAKLEALLDKFVTMMQELRRAGIAHGDLQHGNILVCNDELRLVDYDGMFVPAMKGFAAGELGHRNYQHPDRAAHHFGPYLDNFSAWIIYASVRALQIDSRLMHQLGGGDDCLLFRQADFMDPLHSPAFAALERHSDSRLNELGRLVRAQLKKDLQNIPYLELPIDKSDDHALDPVSETAPVVRHGARIVRGNLPEWLQDENSEVLSKPEIGHFVSTDSTNTTNKLQPKATTQSWIMPPKPSQHAAWLKPSVPSPTGKQQAAGGRLNQIISNINTATTQLNQQQLLTNPLPQLPLELKVTNVPRLEVKWNPMCDRMDPRETLFMMMFNPVIWAMFFFGLLGGGSGECAFIAFLCFLFNSILIAALLWAPLKDKKLARAGHAIIASIDDLRTALDPNGKPYYRADISFDWLGVQQYHAIALSRREYRILNSRTAEVILYDPKTDTPRIYAFCRYHPVMTVSMIMNKTFP